MVRKGSGQGRPSAMHPKINWIALAKCVYHERGGQPNCQGRESNKVRS